MKNRWLSAQQTADKVNSNIESILKLLDEESIIVYQYLIDQFKKTDVSKNLLFQFVYRSFYRLDNAGLRNDFKEEYFSLMQKNRNSKGIKFDFKNILDTLYEFETLKDKKTLQFSFVSKMASTIDESYPIYDSKVAYFLGYKSLYNTKEKDPDNKKNERIRKFFEFYDYLKKVYKEIIDKNLIEESLDSFDRKFKDLDCNLAESKKLDFIFWSGGKLFEKQDKDNKKRGVKMDLIELWNLLSKDIIAKIEEHKGLSLFAENRSKFEGWFKVEVCETLSHQFELVIPEKAKIKDAKCIYSDKKNIGNIDVVIGNEWAIELKTVNTSYKVQDFVKKKTRPITDNIKSVIKDIVDLSQNNNYKNKSVCFIVIPLPADERIFQNHINKIKFNKDAPLKDLRQKEFKFVNGSKGILYMGLL